MKYLVCAVSLFVAACGGGGGGGDGGANYLSPQVPAGPTATLSTANQTLVAQDTASGSTLPVQSASLLTGAQITDESMLFQFARDQANKLPTYFSDATATNTLVGVVQSQSSPCQSGGSLTVNVIDANNDGVPSAGDSVTIISNGCRESFGNLSGSFSLVLSSVSGTFGSTSFSAVMTMAFDNFTVSSAQVNASVNGALTYELNASSANSVSASAAANQLSVSANYAGAIRTLDLYNYRATVSQVPDATYGSRTSLSVSGLMVSSALAGQAISFVTTTPWVTRATDRYPSSGVLLITGANRSQLRLSALSGTQLRQELDANGDSTFESTSTVAWTSLM